MKIALVVSTFPPYRGGMGNVAAMHARLLAESGHEVTVFTPWHAGDRAEQRGAFTLRRLRPLVAFGNAAFVPGLARLLAPFDAVFLHYPAFGLAEPVLAALPKRLVLVYHMDPIGKGIKGLVFRAFGKTVTPLLLGAASRIVVTSMDYALAGALGAAFGTIRAKIIELPLAVDTDAFAPGPCSIEDAERFGLGERNILFVGGMDRAHDFKGVRELLAAFAALHDPNARLHLVGDGDLRGQYEREAWRLGLERTARFHGSLPDAPLKRLYRCADLLALPSTNRSEAFGLVLLEAFASSTPVIASDLPGVRTVVRDGETGWLTPPGDIARLAATIAHAMKNQGHLRAMGTAARTDAERRFSLQTLRTGLDTLLSDTPNP